MGGTDYPVHTASVTSVFNSQWFNAKGITHELRLKIRFFFLLLVCLVFARVVIERVSKLDYH